MKRCPSEVVSCSPSPWKAKVTELPEQTLSCAGSSAGSLLLGSHPPGQIQHVPHLESFPGELISGLRGVGSCSCGPSLGAQHTQVTQVLPRCPGPQSHRGETSELRCPKKLLLQPHDSQNPAGSGEQGKRGNGVVGTFLLLSLLSHLQ